MLGLPVCSEAEEAQVAIDRWGFFLQRSKGKQGYDLGHLNPFQKSKDNSLQKSNLFFLNEKSNDMLDD